VVAGLLGLGLDEIVRRAEQARRKRVRNWSTALLLLTVTFAGLAVWAEVNRVEAEKQRNHAEQETIKAKENLWSALAALAVSELEKRPVNAAKLALAAWPRDAAMDIPEREVTLNAVSRSLAGLHERIRIPTNSSVMSVAVSHDGARVLTGSLDWTARLWDAATGEEIRAFKGHAGFVFSVAFRPDGARVLTGSADGTARLWDAATGKELRAFKGHEGSVFSVVFSPDGAHVLTGSWDKTARLWDAATGEEIRAFEGHQGSVSSVAFSPDGARVLTGSEDNTARLWDISGIPPGSIFDIACTWLQDHDLSGLGKDYGLDLSHEAPICQKDASGRFTTPLPDPPMPK